MRNMVKSSPSQVLIRYRSVFDDFDGIDTTKWTTLAADSGAAAAAAATSEASLTTGATDNNEAAIYTTIANWTLSADKSLAFEAICSYTEANTDDANVAIGLSSAWGANLLADNGAGPSNNCTAILIYKIDGGTTWKILTSKGTDQTITDTGIAVSGYSRWIVNVAEISGGVAEVTFQHSAAATSDPLDLLKPSQIPALPLKHTITIASAAAMKFGAYVKAGGANSEVLKVDVLAINQTR